MKSSAVLWALVALNAVLLLGFIGRLTSGNTAVAQGVRRPGEYAMIPGEVTGGSSGVVYVIDTTNGLLTAMTFDQNSNPPRLVSLPKIDLATIFAKGAGAVEPQAPARGKGR